MARVCPACGGRLFVEYIHLAVYKAPVDATTGKWGKPRKVYEQRDHTAAPKYICSKCRWEYIPDLIG